MNETSAPAPKFWTDETLAACAAQPGTRWETPKEAKKWNDFYAEFDALVNES